MSNSETTTIGCSPFGCLTAIVGILGLWWLVFGFTYDGTRYSVGCDGVTKETVAP